MIGFKKNKQIISEDELAVEGRHDKGRIKNLDKLYIIIALIMLLGWSLWNYGGIKLPSINFNFISDYFAERSALKDENFISWDRNRTALVQGEYIYYLNQNTGGIYRIKKDGTGSRMLIRGHVSEFHMKNDCIYYIDPDHHLMKYNLDGSGALEVSRAQGFNDFNFFDDLIYFRSAPGIFTKISLDGSPAGTMKVNDGTIAVLPYGNFMYEFDMNSLKAFKSRIGGSDKKEAFSFERGFRENLGFYKGWLYYIDNSNTLYRRNLDGSQETKIDENVESYRIDKGLLYYVKLEASVIKKGSPDNGLPSAKVFTTDIDGSNRKEVYSGNGYYSYIGGDVLMNYNPFSNKYSFANIKTMTDINVPEPQYVSLVQNLGEKLGNSKAVSLDIKDDSLIAYRSGNYIYYNNIVNKSLYRYDIKSGESNLILSGTLWDFSMIGDAVFYKSSLDGSLHYSKIDGSLHEQIFDMPVSYFIATREALYFTSFDLKLYKLDFGTNRVSRLTDDAVSTIFIVKDGYLYYKVDGVVSVFTTSSSPEKPPAPTKLYRIKLDGTSREAMDLPVTPGKFDVIGDYVYFLNENLASSEYGPILCRQKFGDSKVEVVIKNCIPDYMFSGNHIFCHTCMNPLSSANPDNRLLMYTLDGKLEGTLEFVDQQYAIDGDIIYSTDYMGKLKAVRLTDIKIK